MALIKNSLSSSDNTIEIVGAGPAGLAAAITLERAGYKVVVHEMHKEVGARFGRDFQGLENWSTHKDVLAVFQEDGLTTDFDFQPCTSCTAFDALGRRYVIENEQPMLYLVERGPGPRTLDSALLKQAMDLGVEVRFSSRCHELEPKGIFANGPKAADAIAVGYHFETAMEDGFWVICDNHIAPKGYAYLLIKQGRGTVKSCMYDDFKQEKLYVQRTVEAFQHFVNLEMKNPRFHGGTANFHIPRTGYCGAHPLAGEQAGFQDTLWGFGIRLAINSGILAARSIIENKNYDVLWQQSLKPQMETSVVNRVLYSLLGNRGYSWFLNWVASSQDPRNLLRQQYQASWYKRLLMPWARRRYKSLRKDEYNDKNLSIRQIP